MDITNNELIDEMIWRRVHMENLKLVNEEFKQDNHENFGYFMEDYETTDETPLCEELFTVQMIRELNYYSYDEDTSYGILTTNYSGDNLFTCRNKRGEYIINHEVKYEFDYPRAKTLNNYRNNNNIQHGYNIDKYMKFYIKN